MLSLAVSALSDCHNDVNNNSVYVTMMSSIIQCVCHNDVINNLVYVTMIHQ